MEAENQDPNQMNIELPEDVAEGIYSNLAIITHSPTEFVIDFVKIMPGVPKARVKSRIVLTPQHAKRLYESVHGAIRETEAQGPIPMNFGGPTGQA
jgi:hypothetical protein